MVVYQREEEEREGEKREGKGKVKCGDQGITAKDMIKWIQGKS